MSEQLKKAIQIFASLKIVCFLVHLSCNDVSCLRNSPCHMSFVAFLTALAETLDKFVLPSLLISLGTSVM